MLSRDIGPAKGCNKTGNGERETGKWKIGTLNREWVMGLLMTVVRV